MQLLQFSDSQRMIDQLHRDVELIASGLEKISAKRYTGVQSSWVRVQLSGCKVWHYETNYKPKQIFPILSTYFPFFRLTQVFDTQEF